MTHPAEITNVWDWQRFETAITGLRDGITRLDAYIAGIHDSRHDWRDETRERQQWTDIDEMARRETEFDWASDGYLDGRYHRAVEE
ncbi:hypothetical protein [Micromonospora sp. LOL_024]|uniref:hypothetical protein n=1 Tax=Micromonospora sp. LOL_024 TaxID=3345412 RepID=UPI003A891F68